MGTTINPFGKKIIKVEGEFCGRPISLEAGRLAFQTGGSVLVRYGDTVVLGLASVGAANLDQDFFPLSIDYEEKMYAAGKISGSKFIKREGKPTEEAVLSGRLIDRPLRPLFPKGYRNEMQCIATILSLDPELRSDIPAMIAVSAAVMLTGAPFEGPIAGVRVGLVDGKLVAYPTAKEMETSLLDLVIAGTSDAIMMVEAGSSEVDEKTMVEAIKIGHEAIQSVIELQKKFAAQVGVTPLEYELSLPDESIEKKIEKYLEGKLGAGIRHANVNERELLLGKLLKEVLDEFLAEDTDPKEKVAYMEAFDAVIKKDVRRAILEEGVRPDGRGMEDIRPLSSEVGILPRAHGSSIFTRGSTQALNVTTLAPLSYAQVVDTMGDDKEKRFIHHYNMPGYASGEIKRLGTPGRREIGHGALAERGLRGIIPPEEEFPYTIRTVSEIMSSNGSTSMASVCSSCLSLMDAGVPIKAPVSGIAMGLISAKDSSKAAILSDIMGAEDFAGDMDFKVVGTEKGITALQMDIKIHGITPELMSKALAQAKKGRAFILKHMLSTLDAPRKELSPYAPRIEKLQINPEKIREVIGKGGEMINKIIAETGAEIDIRDTGLVMVAAPNRKSIDAAIQWIKHITAEPEVGMIYDNCRVVKIMDFGVFVEIMPGHEGLVHVSEMANYRVEHPSDIVKEGDKVKVKLVAVDDRGRLVLSMKQAQSK